MTRKEWDALGARGKDAVVADRVMGALWWRSSSTGRRALFMEHPPEWFKVQADGTEALVGGFATYGGFRSYTTSWDAMREVVEKMEALKFWASMVYKTDRNPDGTESAPGWYVVLRCVHGGTRGDYVAFAPMLPEAVCIAALTALGHMEE
jgi:hypothetical protein